MVRLFISPGWKDSDANSSTFYANAEGTKWDIMALIGYWWD
jgi:hypothetical protein